MPSEILHLDWETKSACDLKTAGLYLYAKHPTTDIWLASFAFADGEILNWFPGENCPSRIKAHITSGQKVMAHNAPFEIAICNEIAAKRYGWPSLSPKQMICTMAMSYAMGIPGSLEKASAAMGVQQQKDMAGHRLMLQMSQPRQVKGEGSGELIWWNSWDKIEKLADYGRQDVVVERELGKRLLRLSTRETDIWEMDQKINLKGVKIDLPAAEVAISIVESEKDRLDAKMRELTKNSVATCSAVKQLTDWLAAQGVTDVEGVAKADILALLARKDLPQNVREVITLRQEAAKSSTAKLDAFVSRADRGDHRIRGVLQYHGASTGRWAGRGIQPQNFPRSSFGIYDLSLIFDALKRPGFEEWCDIFFGSPLSTISLALRGFLIADPDNMLVWGDFSSIEARVLAWLAGQTRILEIFKGDGLIYERTASDIFNVPLEKVTKAQRQIAKVAVLALGYQGGVRAFQQMARAYNVKISDEEAETIKKAWRASNSKICQFWYDLEEAAISAVAYPGDISQVGKIKYKAKGSFLFCQLPSGRAICYPYPKIETFDTPWGASKNGLTYMAEDSFSKKWEKQKAYGGLLAENVTQAVARDLLAEALLRVEKAGMDVVLHVHDEIICEVPKCAHFSYKKELEHVMGEVPEWASGLPISVSVEAGARYFK